MLFAITWMYVEIIILSEVKSEKGKYQMILLICGIKKIGINELIYIIEVELQIRKQTHDYQGIGRRRDKVGDWFDITHSYV